MKKTFLTLATAAALTAGLATTANACSYSTFEVEGAAFVSRTMEAPDFMGEHLVIVPRHFEINGKSGDYGFVGMRHADTEWISSGLMNMVSILSLWHFWSLRMWKRGRVTLIISKLLVMYWRMLNQSTRRLNFLARQK
ncbi:hypothetical protein JCM19240_5018 [Vibrio maritimus]|uniref:Choloylglycine hydrolase n=1 Tax=Vibrio maritimus TaxID=990268 RepID=A0A090TJQ1_9VIBR|nr:hypothetical protein JCM19240_5018 [Vibrio maritimus]